MRTAAPGGPPAAVGAAAGGVSRHPRAITWVAVTLAIATVLAAAACTRWPIPKDLAERWLGQRLERSVRIEGDASFCLCPHPSIRVASIEIGAPEWSDRPHFAKVRDADVVVSARSLLSGPLHILSADVGGGDVVLERTEDGRASWRLARTDPKAEPEALPTIDRLEVRDLAWTFIDPSRGADLTGRLSVQDGTASGAPPSLELRAEGRLRGLPVRASAEGGSLLAGERSGRQPLRASAQVGRGRMNFDGTVASLATMDGLDGSYRVSGPALAALGSLVGALLPRTPPFEIEGRLRHAGQRWEVDVAQARVGESDLRGELVFVIGADGGPPRLDGRLVSRRMRIADLGRSVGFGEGKGRTGRVLPDLRLDLPSLSGMEADLKIAIDRLELGSAAPITEIGADLALRGGVLALGSLKAGIAGGTLSGDIRIDGTGKPGRLQLDLRIRNVALQRWLPKLRGEPPIVSRMNADLKLAGPGSSVAEVLARSDGRLRMALGPGEASRLALELAGIDVAESLAVLATRDRAVRLDCGLVDIGIERGVARPAVLVLDTRDTVVTGEGAIDLAAERMDLRLRAAPRDFSPFTLRSPVNVAGTFAAPKVQVERGRIAGTLIASALLGAVVAPIAALLPLLDFGEGDTPSPCRERFAGLDTPAPAKRDKP